MADLASLDREINADAAPQQGVRWTIPFRTDADRNGLEAVRRILGYMPRGELPDISCGCRIAVQDRYQRLKIGSKPADLPLRDAANIVCDNALRVNWEQVCPVPEDGGEVFIVGNPPFLGDNSRSDEQNEDMDHVLAAHLPAHRRIDFVSCWVFKAANYIRGRNARSALVSTNSICQGQSVGALWPYVLTGGIEIGFCRINAS